MADEHADNWPRFKLVTYSAPTGIPYGWDAELLEKGAPDGLVCEALGELMLLEDPSSGPLVCFGRSGLYGRLCLDPRTKQVMYIGYGAIEAGNSEPKVIGPARVVNSSLDQFTASVRAVTARFPFDSEGIGDDTGESREGEGHEDEWAREDRLDDERTQAVEELVENLRRIDPAAVADPDGFWMTFVDDVQIGDYSARDILSPPDY